MNKLISIIIGCTISIMLAVSQMPAAYAIYSPMLSDEVSLVKKHLVKARQTNGIGDVYILLKTLDSPNNGFFNAYADSIKKEITQSLTTSFTDGISLIFGFWFDTKTDITNCLRDDIWTLKALQESLANELLKAALLNDSTNATILWEDYQLISKRISDGNITQGGKEKYIAGLKKRYSETAIWYPQGGQNYYTDCPYTDFGSAFKEVKNSLDNLYETFNSKDGSLALGSFSAMKKVAQQKAIRKAKEWFNKNKISLTLGGEGGYSPRSLTNGPGLKGLVADIETEASFIKGITDSLAKSVWNNITANKSIAEVSKYVEYYKNAQTYKELITDQMETAMKFNLSLQNVSEESLYEIESILVRTNRIIKDAYTTDITDDDLQKFCNKLLKVASVQCRNKTGGDVPTCN